MGTVTQYNLANVQAALGGANPISMNEYYRGGAYVPSTRTTTVSEGPFYAIATAYDYYWRETTSVFVAWGTDGTGGGGTYGISFTFAKGPTSYVYGGATYYRGAVAATTKSVTRYYVSRTYPVTTSINTGVPSSGAISISQLYGAENP